MVKVHVKLCWYRQSYSAFGYNLCEAYKKQPRAPKSYKISQNTRMLIFTQPCNQLTTRLLWSEPEKRLWFCFLLCYIFTGSGVTEVIIVKKSYRSSGLLHSNNNHFKICHHVFFVQMQLIGNCWIGYPNKPEISLSQRLNCNILHTSRAILSFVDFGFILVFNLIKTTVLVGHFFF